MLRVDLPFRNPFIHQASDVLTGGREVLLVKSEWFKNMLLQKLFCLFASRRPILFTLYFQE